MRVRVSVLRVGVLLVFFLIGLEARYAQAQTHTETPATPDHDEGLAQLLPTLLRSTVTLAPSANPNVPSHAAHFLPTGSDNIYLVPQQFNGALLASLATFPLGSSSGGFVFEGDPALGDYRPASRSFGPTFAERALTSGKGNINFGVTFQSARFDSFEGKDLGAGSIKFYLRHQDCCDPVSGESYPNPAFEGDIIETSVSLKMSTSTTALLFNYGITDRWDLGVAVPFVHVSLDANVLAKVDRIATGVGSGAHRFPGSDPDQRLQRSAGAATGLGDLVVRTKYRLVKSPGGGLAAGFDLRMPSGSEDELLGLGAPQGKVTLIASTELGIIGPHANVTYSLAGKSNLEGIDIPNELGYTFGIDAVAGKASVAFDVIGRTLIGAGRFADTTRSFNLLNAPAVTRTEFGRRDGNLTQILGVAGVKLPIRDKLLLTVNAVFAINNAGLEASFIPVIGFEYVFPRQ